MKATGIVRKIDPLGRIVVPKEMRNLLNLRIGDAVEFLLDGGNIVLRPYRTSCVCCGSGDDLLDVQGVLICVNCAEIAADAREAARP